MRKSRCKIKIWQGECYPALSSAKNCWLKVTKNDENKVRTLEYQATNLSKAESHAVKQDLSVHVLLGR